MGPRCGLLGAVVAFFVSSRVCVWVLREQCARGGGRAYKGVQGVPDPKAYFPNPKAYLSNRVWSGVRGVPGRTRAYPAARLGDSLWGVGGGWGGRRGGGGGEGFAGAGVGGGGVDSIPADAYDARC